MNLFSSAFLGVNVGKKTATNYSDLKTLDKEQEISAMCWATEEEQMVRIIQTKQDIFFQTSSSLLNASFLKGQGHKAFFCRASFEVCKFILEHFNKGNCIWCLCEVSCLTSYKQMTTSNNKHYYNICCNFCIIPSLKFMSTFSGLELLFHGAQEDGHGLSPQLFAFKTFPQTFKIKKPEIPGLL